MKSKKVVSKKVHKLLEVKPIPIKTYHIGVYLPDRDLLHFHIEAHEYKREKDSVCFYLITPIGFREFVASFIHVAFIVVTADIPVISPSPKFPEGWGQISPDAAEATGCTERPCK